MSKLIPTIEIGKGEKYEIKRSRFVLCEIEKMRDDNALTDEENKNFAILQEKSSRLEKLARRVSELEDAYYEDFDEEKGALYKRAKSAYDEALRDLVEFEVMADGVANKVQKATIDKVEQLVITLLTINEKGENVRTREEANEIWCTFVDKIGHESAKEWLLHAYNYLAGNDEVEETDPFVMAARAKAEQKANMRRGIVKAK